MKGIQGVATTATQSCLAYSLTWTERSKLPSQLLRTSHPLRQLICRQDGALSLVFLNWPLLAQSLGVLDQSSRLSSQGFQE